MNNKYGICYELIRDGKVRGHLFGSFHMFYRTKNFKDTIMDSFKDSDCLILEANLDKDNLDKEMTTEDIGGNIYYNEDDNILNHLKTKEDKDNYKKLLKPLGIKRYLIRKQLNKIKIKSLKDSYTIISLQSKGISPLFGIDKYFFDLAKSLNKEMLFLEEVKFQLNLIKSLSLNSELAIEQDIIEETEAKVEIKTEKETDVFKDIDNYIAACNNQVLDMCNIVNSYKKNNIKSLKKYISKEFEEMPIESRNALLLNRNLTMTEKIDMIILEGKKPFICVGVAHLVAENNIVSMLRQKGYYLNLI